jgi:hypothetical protein
MLSPSTGEKTIARCSAKIFTFSWSVRAQALSGVLIGGIAMVGVLNFFVAFHSEWTSRVKFVIYSRKVSLRADCIVVWRRWVSLLRDALSSVLLVRCHFRRAFRFSATSSRMWRGMFWLFGTNFLGGGVACHAASWIIWLNSALLLPALGFPLFCGLI